MELARYQTSLANRQNECKEVPTISTVAFLKHKSESSDGFVSSWLPGFIVIFSRPFQHYSFLVASDGTQVVRIVLLGRVFVEKPHFFKDIF